MSGQNVYSVSRITHFIAGLFATDPLLSRVQISGEISNLKYHSSGHVYFTLKDEGAQMPAVMWASRRATGLGFRLKDGDKVVVTGSVVVYEQGGRYQLNALRIENAGGSGQLYERYLALKKQLEQEGLFAPEHKKPIPKHVKCLGVVTAPTGAAVRDIERNARLRNPYVQLYLYPALVQGEGAAESVATGIQILDQIGCDCIIIGRGGGSIEDLWAFNEELVARTIYACSAPVISAVGHETDTTIADFVSDLRVATPTEAAVKAVEDIGETFAAMDRYQARLNQDMRTSILQNREKLAVRQRAWRYLSPENQIREKRQRLDEIEDRMQMVTEQKLSTTKNLWNSAHRNLTRNAEARMDEREHRLALLVQKLDGLSPIRKLTQGYSYAETEEGHNISSITHVEKGDAIRIHVTDGVITGTVQDTEERKRT